MFLYEWVSYSECNFQKSFPNITFRKVTVKHKNFLEMTFFFGFVHIHLKLLFILFLTLDHDKLPLIGIEPANFGYVTSLSTPWINGILMTIIKLLLIGSILLRMHQEVSTS